MVRTCVQEGHASGILIGSAIMRPQAEREPLAFVRCKFSPGMLVCSGSKLSCTRQQNQYFPAYTKLRVGKYAIGRGWGRWYRPVSIPIEGVAAGSNLLGLYVLYG